MNGIDYLLDTNFILGLLQSSPDTLALIKSRQTLLRSITPDQGGQADLIAISKAQTEQHINTCYT